jgi:hypothetical protein
LTYYWGYALKGTQENGYDDRLLKMVNQMIKANHHVLPGLLEVLVSQKYPVPCPAEETWHDRFLPRQGGRKARDYNRLKGV